MILLPSISAGLPSGLVPAAALVRSSPEPPRPARAAGPERSQPGEGHLEAGGVLPQRQGRRVPVRDRAQRPRQDQPRREDSLHAQVAMLNGSLSLSHLVIRMDNLLFALCMCAPFLMSEKRGEKPLNEDMYVILIFCM